MSILNLFGQLATPDYPTFYMVHSEEMDEARRRGAYFDGMVGSLSATVDTTSPWIVEDIPQSTDVALHQERSVEQNAQDSTHTTSNPALRLCTTFLNKYSNEYKALHPVQVPSCSRFLRKHPPSDRDWTNSRKQQRIKSRTPLIFWAPLAFGLISLLIIGLLSRFRTGRSTTSQRAWIMSWLVVGMIMGGLSNRMSLVLIPELKSATNSRLSSFVWRLLGFAALFGICLAPAVGGIVVVGQMISSYGRCIRIDH